MPFQYHMTWSHSVRRWECRRLNRRFVVTCRQLKAQGYLPWDSPETKRETGKAANAWLKDRLREEAPARKPVERGVRCGYWTSAYLARRAGDATQGVISPSEQEGIRLAVESFRDWFGEARPIREVDGEVWQGWYDYVRAASLASETKKKRMRHVRTLLVWLVEKGAVAQFPSLITLRPRFASTREELTPPTADEVKAVLGAAPGRLKCVLLVMLNTGLNQVDVADLRRGQYADGRITRGRSKTAKKATRAVAWKLWPATIALLDRFAETEGERLLLTEKGGPWTRDEFADGKRSRTDNVASAFRHLKAPFSLKGLRAFGGDAIRRRFGKHVADHFLGHGQDPVERAYFARHQDELDEAVDWLGRELGLTP